MRRASLESADRRAAGEPLQYVLGTWPFRSVELLVDRRVLIPRPETEQVVEVALAELARVAAARRSAGQRHGPLVCVDLGTGSGAIALSLAVEGGIFGLPARGVGHRRLGRRPGRGPGQPRAAGRRTTRRPPAGCAGRGLLVRRPARPAGRAESTWWCPTRPTCPRPSTPISIPAVRQWEPRSALVAGPGPRGVAGLADVEAVVSGAVGWLRPDGGLVVELAPHRPTRRSTPPAGPDSAGWAPARDLAGRLRMLVARR